MKIASKTFVFEIMQKITEFNFFSATNGDGGEELRDETLCIFFPLQLHHYSPASREQIKTNTNPYDHWEK
ncbi:hypothetical protein E2C01_044893 [Portunus trituberculatus]|uniref:Uncharacterized protein n=1 Tax=Portunus trituberculatus TaxID=210409 RepID=A0A5B7FZK5_PORTR|nr:hypothetical protein [Portunus trituberculatus]